MQTFIEAGDLKPNEIDVRSDELQSIFNKFETAQNELECSYDTDHPIDRRQFDDQYYYVKVRFKEFLHFILSPPRSRHSSPGSCSSDHSSNLSLSHHSGSTRIKLPIIKLLLMAVHAVGCMSEIHLKH